MKAVRQDVEFDQPNAVGVVKGDGTGLSLGFNELRSNKRSVMSNPTDPYHAHVYYEGNAWAVAERLHQELTDMRASGALPNLIRVGKMQNKSVGPHPKPQFEIQFLAAALPSIVPMLKATGLTALVHPLTDDDLADHTTLAEWIGEPLPLDESVLDPPGHNQGIARFGKVDF